MKAARGEGPVEVKLRFTMIQTLEASIDEKGRFQMLETLHLPGARRALVTILEEPARESNEAALLSEAALSDWSHDKEEEAWPHLREI